MKKILNECKYQQTDLDKLSGGGNVDRIQMDKNKYVSWLKSENQND